MSLFDQVSRTLGSALQGMDGEQAGLIGGVLDALGKEHEGGLSALVQLFEKKGLGDVVSSWIGTGANLPISAGQIQEVLGSQWVQQLAQQMGLSPDAVTAKLAELLPKAVDQLTPDGKLPESGVFAGATNLLKGARS